MENANNIKPINCIMIFQLAASLLLSSKTSGKNRDTAKRKIMKAQEVRHALQPSSNMNTINIH